MQLLDDLAQLAYFSVEIEIFFNVDDRAIMIAVLSHDLRAVDPAFNVFYHDLRE